MILPVLNRCLGLKVQDCFSIHFFIYISEKKIKENNAN